MSDTLNVQPFQVLLNWILTELEENQSVFGIHRSLFYTPRPDSPYATENLFGQPLATPIGPGAGPHTQLAQNIVCAWLSGARFIELVDALDDAERHVAMHSGHLSRLNDIDRQVVTPEALALSPLLCAAEDVPAWIAGYEAMGVTELAFEPMGDIPAELERFARAAG